MKVFRIMKDWVIPGYADECIGDVVFSTWYGFFSGFPAKDYGVVKKFVPEKWLQYLEPFPKDLKNVFCDVSEAMFSKDEYGKTSNGVLFAKSDKRVFLFDDLQKLNGYYFPDVIRYDVAGIKERKVTYSGYVERGKKAVQFMFIGTYNYAPFVPFREGVFSVVARDIKDVFADSVWSVEWFWPIVVFPEPIEYDFAEFLNGCVRYWFENRSYGFCVGDVKAIEEFVNDCDVLSAFGDV